MVANLGRRGSQFAASIVLLALLAVPGRADGLSRKLLQSTNSGVFPWFGMPPAGNSAPSRSSGSSAAAMAGAAAGPAAAPGAAPSANSTDCPGITLRLNSIEVYDDVIDRPGAQLSVQCYLKDGGAFPAVTFPVDSDVVRSASGARYRPGEPVAQLSCGQAASCTAAYATMSSGSAAAPGLTWTVLADGGCWFDYRHFTQLSYQEPLSAWTCTKPPVRYTLECVECSDPNFPWDTALALAGPPLSEEASGDGSTTLNSVMVIISVTVVAGAVVLVVTALLLRTRRRAGEEAARMTELVSRARAEGATRRRRPTIKPPALFVVGDPSDAPPPEGYAGPIVVLHCGEGDEEAAAAAARGELGRSDSGLLLRWPQIAIARPEVPAEAEVEAEDGDGAEGSGASARQRSDSDASASRSSSAAAPAEPRADDQRSRPSARTQDQV